jgi:tRNA dimethylallyltransferase
MKSTKTLIVVCGPTASGKTSLAIQLAKYYDAEIFSADARQFYCEMEIGTAKPNTEELATVPHHFINNKSIHDNYTAGAYEKDAIAALSAYFETKDVAILCGGSGLYIKAVTEGLEEKKPISEDVKRTIAQLSLKEMAQKIKELDPEYYAIADIQNPRRISRALELIINSGKKMSEMNTGVIKKRDFRIIYIGVEVPREELYNRINQRVEKMIAGGLEEEARKLYAERQLLALQTVGYKEWFDCFDEKHTKPETIALIKQNTRNYAKRQFTWFRKVVDMNWFNPSNLTEIIDLIQSETKY